MQGMGLARWVVLATSGQNAVMLAVAVALLLVPSRVLACLLSRLVPLHDEDPAPETHRKSCCPVRGVRLQHGGGVSGGVSHILNIAVQHQPAEPWHLPAPAHGGPPLTYRFGRVQETVRKAVSKGLRITVGYALLLVLLGCVREWLAAGAAIRCGCQPPRCCPWQACRQAALSCWVCCAPYGVHWPKKRKAYLTKGTQPCGCACISQKEADREQ